MFGKNVDFVAVLFITLVMLLFGRVRSWQGPSWPTEALDSIRLENAIRVESCPLPRDILSNLFCIMHR
jgi:hypothetical protein